MMQFYRQRIERESKAGEEAGQVRKIEDVERELRLTGIRAERDTVFRLVRARMLPRKRPGAWCATSTCSKPATRRPRRRSRLSRRRSAASGSYSKSDGPVLGRRAGTRGQPGPSLRPRPRRRRWPTGSRAAPRPALARAPPSHRAG